ncbi:MAG: DUF4347 domain-containing protein, partial [Gammaproteobacteria bacterium]|nr:DUF4347 domain-containing protein [Gammaproteobacteria bacterium]
MGKPTKRDAAPSLYLEAMEPRLLLSADPLGGGVILDRPDGDLNDDWIGAQDGERVLETLGAITLDPGPGEPSDPDTEEALLALISLDGAPDDLQDEFGWDAARLGSISEAPAPELVFVDSRTPDHEGLVSGIVSDDPERGFLVYLLDTEQDGVQQITDILRQHDDVSAIHLISHGSRGSLELGSTVLSDRNIGDYSAPLESWREHLAEGADLLIYGCDVAEAADGQSFIGRLAGLTGADVAASDDRTGQVVQGGDWNLEYRTGAIQAEIAVDSQTQLNYRGTLDLDTFKQDAGGYTGTVDTYVDNENPADTNIGTQDDLTTNDGKRQVLIRFDDLFARNGGPIPDYAIINSATLTLDVSGQNSSADIDIHRMLNSWDETSTWNSLSNGVSLDGTEAVVTAEASEDGGDASAVFDVTGSVSAWSWGSGVNYGWVLVSDDGSDWKATSSEKSTLAERPLLSVDYTPVDLIVTNASDTVSIGVDTGTIQVGGSFGADGISLREAVHAANNTVGQTVIGFNISDTGVHTINLGSELPEIIRSIIIDGRTETDYSGTPLIEIRGSDGEGLTLGMGSDNSAIRGLAIGGSTSAGIEVLSNNNEIAYNHIGTNPSGTLFNGNIGGIKIQGGADNQILDNLISGNSVYAIALQNNADDNVIQGNLIGTDFSGLSPLGNSGSIIVDESAGNLIGGSDVDQRNIIAGNAGAGILITGSASTGNQIQGNFIGLGSDGSQEMGNSGSGVVVSAGASGNLIGGESTGTGNIISANATNGIEITDTGTASNQVQGNYIGTDATGSIAKGNDGHGIFIKNGATDNTIGGNNPDARNVISANALSGIRISDAGTSGNLVQGNYIGTGADGLSSSGSGNGQKGVRVSDGATNNTIGGTGAGDGNLIAYNTKSGVVLSQVLTVDNAVLGNAIHSNGVLGIDIVGDTPDGVETNDSKDPDSGPNNKQNFPLLLTAIANSAADEVWVFGGLDSEPGKTYRIEFFSNDNSESHGEASAYLGCTEVTTDGDSGLVVISHDVSASLSAGDYITSTATEVVAGTPRSTSEFSANLIVKFKPQVELPDGSSGYTEDQAPVLVAPSAIVTDRDATDFKDGRLTVTLSANGTVNDRLGIRDEGVGATSISLSSNEVRYGSPANKIGSFSGGTGYLDPLVISFDSTNATIEAVQALVENITFSNVSELPDTADRTITFELVDKQTLVSDTDSRTATVTASNDDPKNNGGFPSTDLNLNEEATTDVDLQLIDLVDPDADGGDLTLRLRSTSGGIFTAPTAGLMEVAVENSGQRLKLTGTLAEFDTYLSDPTRIQYTGGLDIFGDDADSISVHVRDKGNTGDGGNSWISLGALNVDINPVNDAPTLGGGPLDLGDTRYDTTMVGIQVSTLLGGLTLGDADGDSPGIAVIDTTGFNLWQYSLDSTDGSDGTWTAFGTLNEDSALLLSESSWVSYVPDGANPESSSFEFRAWDKSSGTASAFNDRQLGDTKPNGDATPFSSDSVSAQLAVTGTQSISGTVYEDVDGDGAVADDGIGRGDVDVMLYLDDGDGIPDIGDTLVGTTTTGSTGSYSFSDMVDGSYFVVVDSKTISPASGYNGGHNLDKVWAEQTYGSTGSWLGGGFTGIDGNLFGGRQVGVSDDADSLMTSEHLVRVTVGGDNVSGIDYGFNFNIVNHTADADDHAGKDRTMQGSLRQAVQNANAQVGVQTISVPGGVITLTGSGDDNAKEGDLDITDDLVMKGFGITTTTINGNASDRVFDVRSSASLAISDMGISNGSSNDGGGIRVDSGASLTISDVTVIDSEATSNGGGIYNKGTLNILDSTVSGNSVVGGKGGGIYNAGSLTVIGSTISGNDADKGAGIYHDGDLLSLTNVTLGDNTATDAGGGIYTRGPIGLTNVTVAFNQAVSGGGIHLEGGSADAVLKNVILADNTGGNVSAPLGSVTNSMDTDGSSGLVATPLASLKLDTSLLDNGGPTATYALLAGSPAIDFGARADMPVTDQRSFLRGDGLPDSGAYEFGSSRDTTADYLDRFDAYTYSGDDGALPWSNDWQEIGEADGAESGSVSVWNELGERGGVLWSENDIGLWRQADLSGAESAQLSFDWAMLNTEGGDSVSLEISTDGVNWNTLATFEGPLDHSTMQSASYDISEYIDSDTRIKFETTAGFSANNKFFFDNVSIHLSLKNSSTPVNSLPVTQNTDEDQSITFNAANGNLISIGGDVSGDLQVSLSVDHGLLTLSGNSGLSFTSGDGTADAAMIFSGSQADINSALLGLVYLPDLGYSGADSLQLSTIDAGMALLDLDSNLQGHYRFDSGSPGTDSGPGGGNDGSLNNGAAVVSDPDRGDVLSLDGVDDHMKVDGFFANPTDLTLATWVNIADGNTGDIISLGDNVTLRNEDGGLFLRGFYNDGTFWQSTQWTSGIDGTGWRHIAYTFDDGSDTQVLYLDGVEIARSSHAGSIIYSEGTDTFIGMHGNGGSSFYLQGLVDDARIYQTALSATQVAELAGSPADSRDQDTLGITINDRPVADDGAASPYSIKIGESLSLDGSDSSDSDGTITAYEWDINNDGSFEQSGINAGYTWDQLKAAGVTYDGNYDIALRVTDNDGATDTQVFTLTVDPGALLMVAKDTYIDNSTKAENHGLSTSLIVDQSGGGLADVRTLVQFDLGDLPSGTTITSATLQMQATANTGALTIQVYEVTEAWEEGAADGAGDTANWTQRNDTDNWSTAGGGVVSPVAGASLNTPSTGLHTWTITSLVQDWHTGGKANNGLMLANPDEPGIHSVTYQSSENTNGPQLLLTFTANTAPDFTRFAGPVESTSEDTQVEISFSDLAIEGDESDSDGTVDAFIVESIASGTLMIGADAASATPWAVGSNDTIDDTRLAYWTPATDDNGTLNSFVVVAEDDDGAKSSSGVTVQVSVTPVNDAPVLADDTPALVGIDEDSTDPAGNSVGEILVDGSITDADGSAVESIAVVGAEDSHGTWQYSIDNGGTWSAVNDGSLAADHALLLDGSLSGAATQKLRFVPDADYHGSANFDFRAWDQSLGVSAGTYADTTANGGVTVFSITTNEAGITINPVADDPEFDANGPFSIDENSAVGTSVGDIDANDGEGSYGASNLIITEVMYAPNDSASDDWEWVELYNAGSIAVDLSGYVLDDSNGLALSGANIASGSIGAGATAVLYNADDLAAASFQAAWGGGLDLIGVTDWGLLQLNNDGDTLSLWSSFADYNGDDVAHSNTLHTLVYDDTGLWPSPDNAGSIYLTDLSADPSVGSSWALSSVGAAGPTGTTAYQSSSSGSNAGLDIGSPNGGNSGEGVLYSIVTNTDPDGDGNDAFTIDQVTGVIRVNDVDDLDYESNNSLGITVRADDGTSTKDSLVNIDLNDLNESPSQSGIFNMGATRFDQTTAGVLVSTIVTGTAAGDPDGDTLGIAVFGTTGLGNWQYSVDSSDGTDGSWRNFGTVNSNGALLLSEVTWIRYIPDGTNHETADFDFRAWDQTTDAPSTSLTSKYGDTTGGGVTSAYGSGSASVSLVVTDTTVDAVNDNYTTNQNTVLNVSVTGVLDNDRLVGTADFTPGAVLEYLAWADIDGNNVWEDNTQVDGFDFAAPTVIRDTVLSDAPPGIGAAYRFDGTGGGETNQGITMIPGEQSTDPASFEFWIRPTDGTGKEIILDLGNTSYAGASLRLNESSLEWTVWSSGNAVSTAQDIAAEIASGDFIHIVASIDPGNTDTVSLTVNGGATATATNLFVNDWSSFPAETGIGQIGGSTTITLIPAGADSFEGEIAAFRFYEFELSDAQITHNYNAVDLDVTSYDSTSVSGASVSVNPDGSFSYDPGTLFNYLTAGETALDTFTYTAQDIKGYTDTATVTITLTGANDGATVAGVTSSASEDAAVYTVNLLASSSDSDSTDVLSVETVSLVSGDATGITDNGDGTFSVDPS